MTCSVRSPRKKSKALPRVALKNTFSRAAISCQRIVVERCTMTTLLKEQAWQSGLVLSDETPEWNQNDWPPLVGGWRAGHATVVLDHLDTENETNDRGQTVVVLGGWQQGQGVTKSVLVLNLADPDRQWREGPPMNKSREGHAAVVCNGGVYVVGGDDSIFTCLNCIERIDSNDLLQSSTTNSNTHERHWTTLNCRLSVERFGCCAVAVHNRYIVVMGGCSNDRYLSSVDIIDTNNYTVTAGPSMTVPRRGCSSAVIGHRIFVVGGRNDDNVLDSVEYVDFAEERKDDTLRSVISFSPTWITHSELVLSNTRSSCAVIAVGSCLVVVGEWGNSTVEVLDTHRNRVWNLPLLGNHRNGCSLVTVANQVAVIGGWENPSCATLPLMDRNSWCFRRLCEQQSNGWYHSLEGICIRDADVSPSCTLTSARKRARPNTRRCDKG